VTAQLIQEGQEIRNIASELLESLPVGSIFEYVGGGDEAWEKHDDGRWHYLGNTDNSHPSRTFGGYHVVIARLGLGAPSPTEVPTLDRFRFKYRQHVLKACNARNIRDINPALAELGVSEAAFPLGVGAQIGCDEDRRRLTEESVIQIGNPESWFSGLYRLTRNGWVRLIGGLPDNPPIQRLWTVIKVGGEEVHQHWIDRPPEPGEEDRILNFKAQAWEVGWKHKSRRGWCSDYDAIVNRVGVSVEALTLAQKRGIYIPVSGRGVRIDVTQQQARPIGTVFRWIHRNDPRRWAWYIRVDNSSNAAGTVRLFDSGQLDLRSGNYAESAEMMGQPTGDGVLDIQMDFAQMREVWDHLPAGTEFTYSGTSYVMCADHRSTDSARRGVRRGVLPTTGNYGLADYGANPTFVITHIPAP
jgi:hypothetical protein